MLISESSNNILGSIVVLSRLYGVWALGPYVSLPCHKSSLDSGHSLLQSFSWGLFD